MQSYRLILKTIVASLVVIGTNALGNYALKRGLRHTDVSATTWAPMPYIRALFHPWVMAGVILMLGWLYSRLALLSWADLSYVLPITSFSYVLSAILGASWLHENVSSIHWIGTCVIALGVAVTSLTFPETTPGRDHTFSETTPERSHTE